MTLRGATPAAQAEIAQAANAPCWLIEIHLSVDLVRATSAYRAVAWGGNTYEALGHLLDVGDIEESDGLEINQTTVTVSGVDQSMIAVLLAQDYLDRQLVIRKGFFDASEAVVADPVLVFDGRIESAGVLEDPDAGTCTVAITASSHWIDFERRAGRHTNHEEQQLWFSGDLGFEYVSQLSLDIKWGKK